MILNQNQLSLQRKPTPTGTVTCVATIFIVVLNLSLTSALIYYGPSIDSLTRKQDGNSSPGKNQGQTIYLSDYSPVFSVLVPFVPNTAFANRSVISTYFKDFHQGEFYVEAPKGYGVVAIVQILRMFTVNGEPTQCLDFIRFRAEPRSPSSSNETKLSPKICGQVDDDDLTLHPKGLIGVRNFVSFSGIMATEIVIVSTLLKGKWEPGRNQQFETVIAIEISYTAFPLRAKLKIPEMSQSPPVLLSTGTDTETNANNNNKYLSNPQLALSVNSLECEILNDGDQNQDSLLESRSSRSVSQNIEEFKNITWRLRPCLNFKGAKSDFLNANNRIFCIHELLFCDTVVQCGFNFEPSTESEFQSFAGDELSCSSSSYSSNNDALDSELLSLIINSGTNSSSDGSNLIVVNGKNRLNLSVVKQDQPIQVAITQYFIISICCIAGGIVLFGVFWWLRKSHRDFCGKKNLDEDPEMDIHDNGIQPLPSDMYVHRPSIAAVKLEQMIHEHRRQTLAHIHAQGAKSRRGTRAGSLEMSEDEDTKV